MISLNEWSFRFRIQPCVVGGEVSREVAEAIVFDLAREWAELRCYGVGGGIDQYSEGTFVARFGLCATQEQQLIPETDAADLWIRLHEFGQVHGCTLSGSFGPFPRSEQVPVSPESREGGSAATD